jgi:hypothetical protein
MNCDNCQSTNLKPLDGHFTCFDCGCIGVQMYVYSSFTKDIDYAYPIKTITIYKRLKYFTKLIKNIRGQNIPDGKLHQRIVSKIKNRPFRSVKELRAIFRQRQLSQYYDYLYYYWWYFKKTHLIPITNNDARALIQRFNQFEIKYRQLFPNKRNIINYHFIIKKLLTEMGYGQYTRYLKSHRIAKQKKQLCQIYDKVRNAIV